MTQPMNVPTEILSRVLQKCRNHGLDVCLATRTSLAVTQDSALLLFPNVNDGDGFDKEICDKIIDLLHAINPTILWKFEAKYVTDVEYIFMSCSRDNGNISQDIPALADLVSSLKSRHDGEVVAAINAVLHDMPSEITGRDSMVDQTGTLILNHLTSYLCNLRTSFEAEKYSNL